MGIGIIFLKDWGNHFPFFIFRNPLSTSRFMMSGVCTVIQVLPVGILLPFIHLTPPLLEAILLIKTPRNLALSDRAFVIRVFSCESSNLRPLRCSLMRAFSFSATSFLPHIPIIQSSAYLTYSSFVALPLGIYSGIFFRSLISAALLIVSAMSLLPRLTFWLM